MSTSSVPLDPPLQPRHWLRGLLALGIALGIAWVLPISVQRIWLGVPVLPAGDPPPPQIGSTLRSVAPGSVAAIPGSGGIIFAGTAWQDVAPSTQQDAATDSADSAGNGNDVATSDANDTSTPVSNLTPPDSRSAWLVSQLPAGIPRQEYAGWVWLSTTDKGEVLSAKISTSSGQPEVDKVTLERLKRQRLDPAFETLESGSQVPVPYEGLWYFRWVQLSSNTP